MWQILLLENNMQASFCSYTIQYYSMHTYISVFKCDLSTESFLHVLATTTY